jgi:hypothetical protein
MGTSPSTAEGMAAVVVAACSWHVVANGLRDLSSGASGHLTAMADAAFRLKLFG